MVNSMRHIIISLFFASLLFVSIMPIRKKTIKVHFDNSDILFIDPCYLAKDDGVWEQYCFDFEKNESLDKLGCEQGICMGVGDVSPDVLVDEKDGSIIGEIGTDSYLLCCVKLKDVLKYNPEFADYMEAYPENFSVVKEFTGEVVFETKKERYYNEKLPITTIIGKGSTNFHSGFIDDDGSVKLHLSQCNMDD